MIEVREITRRALDLSEVRDQLIGHAISEVLLGRFVGEIFNRQNRQGTNGR
jgi:hypothetical protein